MKVTAIVLLAGNSTRFDSTTPKQFFEINGKPLAFYSIGIFEESINVDEIVLVTKKEYINDVKDLVNKYNFKKVINIVEGGNTRQKSVSNGLKAVSENTDIVAIHDGARPIISQELIGKCIESAKNYGASTVAIPCVDTTVVSKDKILIDNMLDRKTLWSVQTPQCFNLSLIKKAHKEAKIDDASDDASLVKNIGHDVSLVLGSKTNIKVTTQDDLPIVEALIEKNYKND